MMPFGGLNNMRQPDNNNSSGSPSAGKSLEATSFSKKTESAIMTGDKGILSEERKHLLDVKKVELEKKIQERAGAQASSTTSFQQQDSSSTKGDVDNVWRPSLLGTKELEGFFPWIDQVAGTLVPLLKFYFYEEVRKAAVSAMPELLRSANIIPALVNALHKELN
ncbi:hypothetical protein S83_008955 [Arachis hypogaea]